MVFALLEDSVVVNLAEAPADAPLDIIFPGLQAIPVTIATGSPHTGYFFDGDKFVKDRY